MPDALRNIKSIFPAEFNLNSFVQMQAEEAFSNNAIAFLNALSVRLAKDTKARNFPEITAFAFFCRKANVIQLKKKYYPGNNLRVGRGLAFHICPSNVPINFAYSFLSGILSGNLNIVRLPSKSFEQSEIICRTIQELSLYPEFRSYSKRMVFVRYDKHSSTTAFFSSICNARITWGSDRTIAEIKKIILPSQAIDISFADKYSICILNADKYTHEQYPQKTAQLFYNDTLLFDQNACTSPHLIVWLGSEENIKHSKEIFWNSFHRLVKREYKLQEQTAVNKLTNFYRHVIHGNATRKIKMPDNLIWRIETDRLSNEIEKYRCVGGYFTEYNAKSLNDLVEIISEKTQTFSCYHVDSENLMNVIRKKKQNVSVRIVPIGRASDFSLTWDGYNLIEALTKEYATRK